MMDVCMYGRCHSSYARLPEGREYRIQLAYSPLVSRRPTTSYSNRQAFSPSPRIQSANSRVAMATPRAQVSMAGFYDWSTEDFDEVSMASVYQKIAVTHKNKYNKGNKNWCTDGIHLNPGRMFVRDKAELTKGEREIIAGIYKNRGDIQTKTSHVSDIKSHKDAWLVGKHFQKKNNYSANDCERCSVKIPDHLFSRKDGQNKTYVPPPDPYLCDSCKEDCLLVGPLSERQTVIERQTVKKEGSGRKAPPSSPNSTPIYSRKQPPKVPKTKAGEGAVLIESSKTFYDPYEGSKKKKVFVDVFLPKFQTPNLSEEQTSLYTDIGTDLENKLNLDKVNDKESDNFDEGYSSQDRSLKSRHRLFSSPAPCTARQSSAGE
ncbi:uncharacterized protein LOC132719748 [Ruditapes philippinarum]|uniref:uncharacterized protein LOC132719748 n=1 Tax=Ruditapes philippinarum TaxID=129788 RepID=UPI00295AC607|nr:uncharacterized protein LOC132719748 [Ruditapes philippinarum]